MSLSASRLGAALKDAVDSAVSTQPVDRDAMFLAMAQAIVDELTHNTTVTVEGVQTGSSVAFGTIS